MVENNVNVFISRNLESDSIFKKRIAAVANITDLSLVNFDKIIISKPVNCDIIFFYSKNAIKYYFEQFPINEKTEVAVMGKASAAYLKKLTGISASFTGEKSIKNTAERFSRFAKGKKTIFIGAKNSRDSVRLLISNINKTDFCAIYNNSPLKNFSFERCNILIFTSPMNAKTYLEKFEITDEYVICIGMSTFESIKNNNIKNIVISDEPDENSLADCCLKIIQDEF